MSLNDIQLDTSASTRFIVVDPPSVNNLNDIQLQQKAWSAENFGPQSPLLPLLGIGEELGELHHAVLKREQGIRKDEDHLAMEKDAIGDMCIYLMDYCSRRGFVLMELIEDAWDEVKARHKGDGGGLMARQREDGTWAYQNPVGTYD